MRLRDIALNNLRRRKIKSVFLIMGLLFGVATIVTLMSITSAMQSNLGKQFEGIGSKIIIKPKNDTVAFTYGPIVIASGVTFDAKDLTEQALEKVKKQAQLNVVSPKVLGDIELQNKKTMVVGIEFAQELKLKNYWAIEGAVPKQANEVLIGSKVAKTKNLKLNDKFSAEGQTFKIAGVIKPTSGEEDNLIFMELKQSQKLFAKPGTLTFIEVNVGNKTTTDDKTVAAAGEASEGNVDKVVLELRKQLPEAEITAVKEAVDARKQLVDRFANFSIIISIIVVFIGALIVMSTMISSVNERTREIGIFRAIGFRKSHIIQIILFEAGVVSLIGSLLGYLLGLLAAMKGAVLVTKIPLVVGWNPLFMVVVILAGVAVGLLSSAYPAVKASRLDPAEALRYI